MPVTDWERLWRALASRDLMGDVQGEQEMVERWRRMARRLDAGEGARPDPLLEFLLRRLDGSMTVLDIGAGIGRWTLPLARAVRQVTAVEPLSGMCEILRERAAAQEIGNLALVEAPWMEAAVPAHDAAIAAHATYTTPDLLGFVRKMEASARRLCALALRMPAHDGIIGELSLRLHGVWHDSPNFIVAYNLLLAAGYAPNVLIEPRSSRRWIDPTLDEALVRARRHLHLPDDRHDPAIRETLSRRLEPVEGGFRWPDGMRSALVWWEVSPGAPPAR
ncbi:MAG: methyltransferase domain-containing protein [Candidatus Methylomirabilota bacterium]